MKSLLLLNVLSLLFTLASCEEAAKTKKWTLYHRAVSADSSSDWEERGTIELSVTDAEPTITVQNGESIPDSIKELSITDDAYYQVKLGESDIITTVSACNLRRANYRDEIILQLNARAQPLSLAYMPLVSRLAPESCTEYGGSFPPSPSFQTSISFQTAVAGMVVGKPVKDTTGKTVSPPPGLKWLAGGPPRKQRPKGAEGGGKPGEDEEQAPEEKGPFAFLQKYWYILVPMLIMNIMSAQQQPEAPAAVEGGGAAVAAQPAVAAASGGTPQRRSKKVKK